LRRLWHTDLNGFERFPRVAGLVDENRIVESQPILLAEQVSDFCNSFVPRIGL
jgi:hypothetical protein